ncbi:SDR family oxidoreductase [Xanthocytophaga agilis]|uniref:SDR family oxidoreductase n=1 Tax=Xanthocytophaga agilis TaxID=3048010 RepID=A0AAE3R0T7_9BACT|nr:SDR family oxidoreductase [Xanthocytophaga agilis]MDJ1501629.1 SDR family oxidoreductase [Xanthocytophaga agilis]
MSKTIFITGASTGLGKATAKLFHNKGWNIIATMRNPEKETELNRLENITVLPLDVTNLEQIESTVQHALSLGEIDVVFNNAGYGLIGPLEALSDEQITKQLNTNLLGVIRVTKAFIPYFRNKKAGTFISTTSLGGLVTFPLGSIYHAAKWALEGWSESMSFELNAHGVYIKTVAPGGIKTDFMSRSMEFSTIPEYAIISEPMMSNSETMLAAGAMPEDIAAIVYEAATDGENKVRYVAGEDAKAMYAKRLEIGNEGFRAFMKDIFLADKNS